MNRKEDDNPRPRRVGFLTTELGAGGAERVVFELARGLDRDRFEVAGVWCLRPAEGYFAGELSRIGIQPVGLGVRSFLDLPLALLKLRRQLRDSRVELLNAHLHHAVVVAALAARGAANVPLVATHHYNETRRWRYGIEKLLKGRFDSVTAVSRSVADRVGAALELAPDFVRVIPNGVDTRTLGGLGADARAEARRRLRISGDERLIGAVGRLVPDKQPLLLVEAFARLAAADSSLRLVFIGDGPLHERVFRRIGQLGLRERASVVGFMPGAAGLMPGLDLMVLPSRSEGHPLALLEAMACGVPVVASRIPAVREVLSGGDDGPVLTFASGDAEDLAAKLHKTLGDERLLVSMGAAGRELVRSRYGLERMLEAYAELFAELLA